MLGIAKTFPAIALFAATAAFSPMGIAWAAGPFDGTWVIDAHGTGGHVQSTGQTDCPAFRLTFVITDSKISESLAPSPSNSAVIVPSHGRGSSLARGSVAEDGTFAVQWQNFHIVGRITGNTLEAFWTGLCGPRSAKGTRAS